MNTSKTHAQMMARWRGQTHLLDRLYHDDELADGLGAHRAEMMMRYLHFYDRRR